MRIVEEALPVATTIKAGTPVTLTVGSDRYAGYVTEASKSGKTLWFALGFPMGEPIVRGEGDRKATLRHELVHNSNRKSKDDPSMVSARIFRETRSGNFLSIGVARDYRDPSF